MLLSQQQLFSDAQAVTSTAPSTNLIDLGAPGTVLGAPAALIRDIGKGEPIPIVVRLLAAAGGTSPTLVVSVQVDNDVAFGSAKTVYTGPTVAGGTAGQELYLPVYLPEGTDERYLRLLYTTGGTSPTHSITAGVTMAKPSSYPVAGV